MCAEKEGEGGERDGERDSEAYLMVSMLFITSSGI